MSRPENDQTFLEFVGAHVPGLRDADRALHDLVDAVNRNSKAGTIALVIQVKPAAGQHGTALQVSSTVALKAPKDPAPSTLVWTLPSGRAVDYNPNQPTLPLDGEDGADPGKVFTQDAPDHGEDDTVSDIPRTPEQHDRVVQFREASGFAGDAPDYTDDPDNDVDGVPVHGADPESSEDEDDYDKAIRDIEEKSMVYETDPAHQETEVAKALAVAAQGEDSNVHELKAKRAPRNKAADKVTATS